MKIKLFNKTVFSNKSVPQYYTYSMVVMHLSRRYNYINKDINIYDFIINRENLYETFQCDKFYSLNFKLVLDEISQYWKKDENKIF